METAVLTLHSGGHYLLVKTWNRPPGSFGILGLSEEGTYVKDGENYELTAHHGLRRTLRAEGGFSISVTESEDLPEDRKVFSSFTQAKMMITRTSVSGDPEKKLIPFF